MHEICPRDLADKNLASFRLIVFVERREKERIGGWSAFESFLRDTCADLRGEESCTRSWIYIYWCLAIWLLGSSHPLHLYTITVGNPQRQCIGFFDPSSGVSCSRGVFHALPSLPNFPSKVTARIGRVRLLDHVAPPFLFPFRLSPSLSRNREKLRDIEKLSACLLLEYLLKIDLLSQSQSRDEKRLGKLEYPLSLSTVGSTIKFSRTISAIARPIAYLSGIASWETAVSDV